MIALSELLHQLRAALSSKMLPDLPSGEIPTVPDLSNFELPPTVAGNNCDGNDKAISLNIEDNASGHLEITICTFLQFEVEGNLSTDGLFNELEQHISLELSTGFTLSGAFSAGIKVTVVSLTDLQIELDPVHTQLYLQTDLSGSATLGLITADVSGAAALQGQLSFGYCPSCGGNYQDGYEQTGEGSSFYLRRLIGYDLDGALELSLDSMSFMPSIDLGIGFELGIEDDNVFDDIPPVIELPSAQSLLDSMRFSPEQAVSKFMDVVWFMSLYHVFISPTFW